MTSADFERRRRLIGDDLMSVAHNIGVRKREIAVLEQRRDVLQRRLSELESLESARRHYGMIELVRLCRTPCIRFRPLDIDLVLPATDKSSD